MPGFFGRSFSFAFAICLVFWKLRRLQFPFAFLLWSITNRIQKERLVAMVTYILHEKESQVFWVGEDATVLDAAWKMNDHKVGALVVIAHGRLV